MSWETAKSKSGSKQLKLVNFLLTIRSFQKVLFIQYYKEYAEV